MTDQMKDVAHEPVLPKFEPAFQDMPDYDPMNIGGPGGRTNNLEHNEKGILESGLFRTMAKTHTAELASSHNDFRTDIYKTNVGKMA